MKHLIPYYIQQRLEQQEEQGQLLAYTLFIDLSGFTPLTEVLMRKGHLGAERLSNILNEIFEPLVQLMYARGGFIPYFAGDAFTAIFPVQDQEQSALDFIQTAAMARELFQRRENQFDGFTIGLKFGLSYGNVDWGIVGRSKKSFYFKGWAIDRCAYCQTQAQDQDIVIDGSLLALIPDNTFELEPLENDIYKVKGHLDIPAFPAQSQLAELSKEIALQFLPKAVVDYKQEGEFRPVVSIFISFEGVDTHEDLNTLSDVVLEQADTFSAYFKEIDFGDKGGVATIFFGAPTAFENNVSRALEFVLSLTDNLQGKIKEGWLFRVGMTVGIAYTGIVGGQERCQYACVGNRVNLAARLMSKAEWGDILVDEEIQKAQGFIFKHKGDIKYKGIKGNVPTYSLEGRNFDLTPKYQGKLIGRAEELTSIIDFAQPLFEYRNAGVVYLFGEAGVGKSRLAYELRSILLESGRLQWRMCRVDQILRKPFNPFIYFLRNYFKQSQEESLEDNQQNFERIFQQLLVALQTINKEASEQARQELERTKDILAALVGLHQEDSLWEQLDAKGRYLNTIWSIINLLLAESLIKPLILELEDSHWIDDSSMELIQELTRQMPYYPILLFINSRYADDGSKPYPLSPEVAKKIALPFLEVNLNNLSAKGVRAFAENKLEGPIAEEFQALLLRTTNNNPFYVEQMIAYFKESNLVIKKQGEWTIEDEHIKLSNSINAILTARIDRLSEEVKEMVKAAAVIGREFDIPVLSEVLRSQRGTSLMRDEIQTAEKVQIWRAVNELRYIFRHSLLREAVYSMQLQTRLKQLHLYIAQAIEQLYASRLEGRYVDLAFHYGQAEAHEKTAEYLRKAADHARRNYQNHLALEYYQKLLDHLGQKADRTIAIETQLKRGKLLELIGNWEDSEEAFNTALELSEKAADQMLLGQSNNQLGHLLMLRGAYAEALEHLNIAVDIFESMGDHIGAAKVQGNLGNLHLRQGEYLSAKAAFETCMSSDYLQSASSAGAQIVANLGLTHMNLGELEEGVQAIEERLDLYQKANDKQGLATLLVNLGIVQYAKGDYKGAQKSYEQGIELCQELGNKQLYSIALGSLGLVIQEQGDYKEAMELFQKDLDLTEELGDKQGIAIALGLIGDLLKIQGDFYQSVEYLEKNLALCEELGYQKGIAKAVNTLGDVYYFRKEYEQSLHFYDRAIALTRKISHKMVLCSSLIEKGLVLIKMRDTAALLRVVEEALDLAAELGNPDLVFDAKALEIRSLHVNGQTAKALLQLDKLQQEHLSKNQQAEVYYLRYRLLPVDEDARFKAVGLFKALYEQTPRYEFKMRLDSLASSDTGF